jgi:1,4-dihydroxy-2-naphthoate octaprenyltransferase
MVIIIIVVINNYGNAKRGKDTNSISGHSSSSSSRDRNRAKLALVAKAFLVSVFVAMATTAEQQWW